MVLKTLALDKRLKIQSLLTVQGKVVLKKNALNGLFCLAFASPVAAQSNTEAQQKLSFTSVYASFDEGGNGDDGSQFYNRFQYTYSTKKFDIGIASGFIRGERSSSFAGSSGSVSTMTDTSISGTYRAFAGDVSWLGGRRATLAFNADINLPTGKNQLTGAEKNAVFDSFLVDQDRYGEGLNLGVGVSSTVTLSDQLLLGLGASYILRGNFNPDGDAPTRVLDPGNQIVLSAQLLKTSQLYQWNLGYRLINELSTEVDGVAVYDRAVSHELFGSLTYQLSDQWRVQGSALYATRGADDVFDAVSSSLIKSPQDNNGDTYMIALGATRKLNNRDQISFSVSRRVRGDNEFDEANFSFEPSLTRDAIGINYDRQLDGGMTISAGVSYFRVDEGDILGFSGPSFKGTSITLGASYAF